MNKILISTIIVSYNNLNILIDCIESIKKYNDIGSELEIIIVENSNNDNIFNFFCLNYNDIKVIKNINKGFGQGNNVGARAAKGEYLLFLNPDTILVEPIFKFAINKFRCNDRLALFGLKLIDKNFKSNMSYYFIDKHNFIHGQIIKIFNRLNIFLKNCMYISGANIFVRKEIFFQAGMFDENMFMYYEEPDLTKRIKNIGGETGFFKNKKIIHLEGMTTKCNELALNRRLDSAKYYSNKYNLNFKKQIKNEILYNKIKYIYFKIIKKNKNDVVKIIKILKNYGEYFE